MGSTQLNVKKKQIEINEETSKLPKPVRIVKSKIYCRIRCPKHLEKILVLRNRGDLQVCLKCGRYLRTFKCQQCSFEICIECYNEPKEYYKCYCNNGHQLLFQGNLEGHLCGTCNSEIDSAYRCMDCHINLCLKCKKQFLDKYSAESQKCASQHNKRALTFINKEGKCTNCQADCDGYWFCKTCKFSRCLDCKFEQEELFMKSQGQQQTI